MPYVVNSDCILCGACVSGCECGAIKEEETQCHIDPDICIECGVCESNCPHRRSAFWMTRKRPASVLGSLHTCCEDEDLSDIESIRKYVIFDNRGRGEFGRTR